MRAGNVRGSYYRPEIMRILDFIQYNYKRFFVFFFGVFILQMRRHICLLDLARVGARGVQECPACAACTIGCEHIFPLADQPGGPGVRSAGGGDADGDPVQDGVARQRVEEQLVR